MPKLVIPDSTYKQSYLEALREYQADITNAHRLNTYKNLNILEIDTHFEEYVAKLKNEALGINLPSGYVPHTVFWLVEGDTFLGRVDVRHFLNDSLEKIGGHIGYDIRPTQRKKGYGKLALALAIQKAHELGITNILVSCDVDNLASNKIIQANGGELATVYQNKNGTLKNRYLIRNR